MNGSKPYGPPRSRRTPRRRDSPAAAQRLLSPHPSPLPQGLLLPTSLQRISPNPKGIAPSSPGLRGTSNPGTMEAMRHNPNGVASASHERSHNPVGVAARPTMFSQGSSCLATLGYCARIPLGFAFGPIKDVGTVAKSRSSRSKELLAIRPFESVTSVAAFPDCYQVFPGTETRSPRIQAERR